MGVGWLTTEQLGAPTSHATSRSCASQAPQVPAGQRGLQRAAFAWLPSVSERAEVARVPHSALPVTPGTGDCVRDARCVARDYWTPKETEEKALVVHKETNAWAA